MAGHAVEGKQSGACPASTILSHRGILIVADQEPNSGLGKAVSYTLPHWQALTLFLREPGAPLDNNLVERALTGIMSEYELTLLRQRSLEARRQKASWRAGS
jgi:Transposase IS66 family